MIKLQCSRLGILGSHMNKLLRLEYTGCTSSKSIINYFFSLKIFISAGCTDKIHDMTIPAEGHIVFKRCMN
ncbi:hypothetical protein R3W88_009370 [Solanum pinnatisectum]|uniref:Uncharacterized protein n=1 Tax=Solanum pinnatisectum TaxID=50273 RepID=A0AAV9MDL4_9SOLN|nr:hypothetical protein R3W88_009370 [Solanum pinnatisectum]